MPPVTCHWFLPVPIVICHWLDPIGANKISKKKSMKVRYSRRSPRSKLKCCLLIGWWFGSLPTVTLNHLRLNILENLQSSKMKDNFWIWSDESLSWKVQRIFHTVFRAFFSLVLKNYQYKLNKKLENL